MPPAPGNETVQQMLADGGKASMVAMTLGLGKFSQYSKQSYSEENFWRIYNLSSYIAILFEKIKHSLIELVPIWII